jgi:hypothetical protein
MLGADGYPKNWGVTALIPDGGPPRISEFGSAAVALTGIN